MANTNRFIIFPFGRSSLRGALINSDNKRRSAIRILPIPDGAIAGLDRQHAIGIYRIGVSEEPGGIIVIGEGDIEMVHSYLRVNII